MPKEKKQFSVKYDIINIIPNIKESHMSIRFHINAKIILMHTTFKTIPKLVSAKPFLEIK